MPNSPYVDQSVHWKIKTGKASFHELRADELEAAILDSGLATEVLLPIGSGKEATVYACRDGNELVAVKAYRLYGTSHRGGRPVKQNSMGALAAQELELLTHAYRGDARVPRPIRRVENMFSMQYLGDSDGPAPRLLEVELDDPEEFREEVLRTIAKLADAGVVHSDMSPFNILVHDDLPWVIDMGQCYRVDRLGTSPWIRLTEAREALERGLKTFDRYFRKYGLRVDAPTEAASIVRRLDRFGVLL